LQIECVNAIASNQKMQQMKRRLTFCVVRGTTVTTHRHKRALNSAGLPWVWGFPWGFPWVWVWYGYGDCDESPWVMWVICGDF